jgi:hypothetical protein
MIITILLLPLGHISFNLGLQYQSMLHACCLQRKKKLLFGDFFREHCKQNRVEIAK